MATSPPRTASPSSSAGSDSASSYEIVSSPSHSSTLSLESLSYDSDDEIIWDVSLSDGSGSPRTTDFPSVDHEVSLTAGSSHKPQSELTSATPHRTFGDESHMTDSSKSSIPASLPQSSKRKTKKTKRSKHTAPSTYGVVDDTSSIFDQVEPPSSSMYDEAVKYITFFLSNPTKDASARLRFLQSLIIELGLTTAPVPSSLTAATNLLKKHAFLNIHEYLAVRDQGLAALQAVMHPSKSSLIKAMRKRRNSAPLKWVKNNGLQVLLVSCFR